MFLKAKVTSNKKLKQYQYQQLLIQLKDLQENNQMRRASKTHLEVIQI